MIKFIALVSNFFNLDNNKKEIFSMNYILRIIYLKKD